MMNFSQEFEVFVGIHNALSEIGVRFEVLLIWKKFRVLVRKVRAIEIANY